MDEQIRRGCFAPIRNLYMYVDEIGRSKTRRYISHKRLLHFEPARRRRSNTHISVQWYNETQYSCPIKRTIHGSASKQTAALSWARKFGLTTAQKPIFEVGLINSGEIMPHPFWSWFSRRPNLTISLPYSFPYYIFLLSFFKNNLTNSIL